MPTLKRLASTLFVSLVVHFHLSAGVFPAQEQEDISLVMALDTVRTQTGKVDILLALSDNNISKDLQQAIGYATEALKISESIDYPHGIAAANKFLGMGLAETGAFVEALDHLTLALDQYEKLGDSLEVANVYNSLGNQYSYGDNVVEARRYYDLSLEIYENLKIPEKISAINNNIGTIYLDYGMADSALIFLEKAKSSNLEIKNEDGLATNYTNIGYAYALKNDQQNAIESYLKCLEIGVRTGNRSIESVAYLNLGDGYMNLGEYDKAIENLEKGLAIANADGYVYLENTGSYTMGEVYEQKKEYESALGWYKKAEEINEKLTNPENQVAMLNFQSDQLKKAQNAEIERINMLNEQKLKAERFKNYLYLTMAASVLLIFLGTSYFLLKRQRTALQMAQQGEKIREQSDKIMEQSKDISAVNETLRDRNLRLRKLNEEKNYLMSVVAHDLKSPLNQINGLVNVISLTDNNLTEEQKECLSNIYSASGRLSEMVTKVLNREAIDSDQLVINKVNIDISDMLSDSIQNYESLAARKGIRINKSLPTDKVSIYTDRQYLRQIIDNLFSNAIKFSPAKTEIQVNASVQKETVLIEIKDQGPGLTESDMENLFKEHMVLSAKPTGDEISTGLGLSIVKNYTEKLGGKVWAESELDKGATFKVQLPLS